MKFFIQSLMILVVPLLARGQVSIAVGPQWQFREHTDGGQVQTSPGFALEAGIRVLPQLLATLSYVDQVKRETEEGAVAIVSDQYRLNLLGHYFAFGENYPAFSAGLSRLQQATNTAYGSDDKNSVSGKFQPVVGLREELHFMDYVLIGASAQAYVSWGISGPMEYALSAFVGASIY